MFNSADLPFNAYEERFLALVRNNPVVILSAETGAGKSTLGPLALLRAGFGGNKLIGVSEPRRQAATLLAEWVAELYGTECGDEVGYHIGNDRTLGRETKLAYVTEGIVLNQFHSDPYLSRYNVLVLDEVHERGVNQDLLMALVKGVLARRSDFKVVVMSATIDTRKFSTYFNNAPVLEVPGRLFNVQVRYETESTLGRNPYKMCVEKILEILRGNEPGDVLAFLPDQVSIMSVTKQLEDALKNELSQIRVLPLFGSQASEDQKKVFERDGRRRVIIATNIAETSLTIDGVRHVVDTGLIKTAVYVDVSMSALQVTEHSRAGCDQRKGRAGRTENGICHRLFTREEFESRDGFLKPEILRLALDQVLLSLRCLGYSLEEIIALDFIDAPTKDAWMDAQGHLKLLGAIGADGEVTKDGLRMQKFHVEPMIGRMILEGEKRGCLDDVLTIAACLSATGQIFTRPNGYEDDAEKAKQKFVRAGSDELTMLAAWEGWYESDHNHRWAHDNFLSSRTLVQVDRIRDSLIDMMIGEGVDITRAKDEVELRKAIAAGFIVNLARRVENYDYVWNNRQTYIYPGSSVMGMTPQLVVCTKVVESTGKKGPKAYMHGVHAFEKAWLSELVPAHLCEVKFTIEESYVTYRQELISRRTLNGVEIERKVYETIPDELMPHVLAIIS